MHARCMCLQVAWMHRLQACTAQAQHGLGVLQLLCACRAGGSHNLRQQSTIRLSNRDNRDACTQYLVTDSSYSPNHASITLSCVFWYRTAQIRGMAASKTVMMADVVLHHIILTTTGMQESSTRILTKFADSEGGEQTDPSHHRTVSTGL